MKRVNNRPMPKYRHSNFDSHPNCSNENYRESASYKSMRQDVTKRQRELLKRVFGED